MMSPEYLLKGAQPDNFPLNQGPSRVNTCVRDRVQSKPMGIQQFCRVLSESHILVGQAKLGSDSSAAVGTLLRPYPGFRAIAPNIQSEIVFENNYKRLQAAPPNPSLAQGG